MKIKELIALASIRSGRTRGRLSEEMGHKARSRLSKIATGVLQRMASQDVEWVAFF